MTVVYNKKLSIHIPFSIPRVVLAVQFQMENIRRYANGNMLKELDPSNVWKMNRDTMNMLSIFYFNC